jgi:hypothetical protein
VVVTASFLGNMGGHGGVETTFLGAPAWGQAGSSGGEDVRHRVPMAGNEGTGAECQGIEEGNSGPVGCCVGLRDRMPNRRVMGNEWLVG